MFQFPSLATKLYEAELLEYEIQWVAPFGNPRITVCLPLPEAYRS
jgi:hypothetical protein